jgi:Holliday junction resolvasome RuvABC endonuclease subunit
MVKILGLDISSVSTGYCIVDDGKLVKSTLGLIENESKDSIGIKLCHFENEVRKLVIKHKPNFVVIEDIFRGPNIKTFKTLAMFRGVCFKIVFELINIEPISIMPSEARKILGVNGITKEDGFEFIIDKYNFLEFDFDTHNDITDSIILALAYHKASSTGIKIGKSKKKNSKKRRKNESI